MQAKGIIMNLAVKVSVDLENLIQRLSVKEKIKLAHELERQTRRERWTPLLNRIQKKTAKNRLSEKEIVALVKETRKELRGKSRH
jgi:hypothetical protein